MSQPRSCIFCEQPCDGSFCAYCDRNQETQKGIPTIKDIRRVVAEEIKAAGTTGCWLTPREARLLRGVVMELRPGDADCNMAEIEALRTKLDKAKSF